MINFERDAKIQFWIFGGPLFIGAFVAWIAFFQPYGLILISTSIVGAWLIIKPKVTSKQRSKQPIEWGSANMTPQERRSYRTGWGILLISIVTSLVFKYGGY
ncbi:hypothetical protein ACLVWU_08715 [Bdellovibrio sp. HCB290]|uniref:hypothetical protein n=1 Tax=Bdellovibrio sp. HCB290 TaxID=3394356 RepID=UPI0039B5113A